MKIDIKATLVASYSIVMLLITTSAAAADAERRYDFIIEADFRQLSDHTGTESADRTNCVPMTATVSQDKYLLRELSWDRSRYLRDFKSVEGLTETASGWQWQLPRTGGTLSFCAELDHKRGDKFDARVMPNWAIFRADDLFPAASSVVAKNSRSRTRLRFKLPDGWRSVTAYPEVEEHVYKIENPDRQFDRPVGWVQLGDLGIRRDRLANTQVAVSAPVGQEVTRLEIMTLLTFTMPTVRDWFPEFPKRLLVASAVDGMWRGALSGPASLYMHGERPLVSENGTSAVLHELAHVGMQRRAVANADWIDEGLAEYLSLVMLHRAGGLTDRRFKSALADQREWAKSADTLKGKYSSGAQTAKAVTVFAALHEEIGDQHFHRFVETLASPGPAISLAMLRDIAEGLTGNTVSSLAGIK